MKNFLSKAKQIQYQYWLLISLVYLSLIYSTGLHYAHKPERTISLSYFHHKLDHPLQQYYADIGILSGKADLHYNGSDFWKLSSYWSDVGYYILQVKSLELSVAPFKYRFVPTTLVHWLHIISGLDIVKSFVIVNVLFVTLTAILFTFYLQNYFYFSKEISCLGGILVVTMLPITRTVPFPMLEPASVFFMMLIFISVISRNVPLFIISSLLGVASKEILVISSISWFVENFQYKDKKKLATDISISSIPICGGMFIRLALGGSPVEVNYGFNILKGEFPKYYGQRIFKLSSLIALLGKVFLSFSFLWLGLLNIDKNKFLKRHSVIIPIVIVAAFILSQRISRVLGILFPVIIPMFLLFFKREERRYLPGS